MGPMIHMGPVGPTRPMTHQTHALGIEIGGSALRMGVIDREGSVGHSKRTSSSHLRDQSCAMTQLLCEVERFLTEADVQVTDLAGIGIAAAGLVDNERRAMVSASNLGWRDLEIGSPVEEHTGIRTVVDKDTNMAALGELMVGAGRGFDSFIYAAIGTGVGGSVIYGGQLVRGIGNRAGEFGHLIAGGEEICGCGARGCLETLAGGAWLARRAREAIADGSRSIIAELAGNSVDEITARTVVEAAKQGDGLAVSLLATAADALGAALINTIRMIYPEAVIIGGTVGSVRRFVFEPVKAFVESNSVLPGTNLPPVHVLPAGLGDSAAIIGAALSVF